MRTEEKKDDQAADGLFDFSCIDPHPYGVLPEGNVFSSASRKQKRQAPLPDEIFQQVLCLCDGRTLSRVVQTCRDWYVAGHQPELWRDAVLREHGGVLEEFVGNSWKDTYSKLVCPKARRPSLHMPMTVSGVYSDVYYRTHLCRSFRIPQSWAYPGGSVPRINGALSVDAFLDRFEVPNKPVVLAGFARSWKAHQKWNDASYWRSLTREAFRATSGAAPLPANFTLGAYQAYCRANFLEESPLYLFDRTALLDGPLRDDYYPDLRRSCPFWDPASSDSNGHDLFHYLGEGKRPDHTWLICGPKRSGSAFHMDPNATHAWNAAIVGRKRWIFYPPGVTPPGVHPSPSGDQVAMPISLGEWLLNYYTSEHLPNLSPYVSSRVRALECTVEPGDIIFVPHGWWHAVINLDDYNVAITHNYVSRSNLPTVLRFMDRKQDQISGCRDRADSVKPDHLKEEFRKAMEKHGHGDWWDEAEVIAKERWICRAWTDDDIEGVAEPRQKKQVHRKRKTQGETSIMAKAKKDTRGNEGFSFSFV